MKNFKQYLEEALRSTVDAEGNHTPGTIRKVIGALGGKRISPWNAFTSDIAKEGRVLAKAHAVQAEHDRGAPQRAKHAAMQAASWAAAEASAARRENERNMTSVPIEFGGGREPKDAHRDARRGIREMAIDPNPRPIASPSPEPTNVIRGLPKRVYRRVNLPRPSSGVKNDAKNPYTRGQPPRGGNLIKHPYAPRQEDFVGMYEDSGERGGSPEDGNTGYGLPRKNSRFYPAKNPRPTGPGTEYHMETILKKIEARKAAEAAAAEAAAAAAEAAKSAGEQEPEHWRDFPTDVRYDQYGDQD